MICPRGILLEPQMAPARPYQPISVGLRFLACRPQTLFFLSYIAPAFLITPRSVPITYMKLVSATVEH